MHRIVRVLAALAVACTPSLASADWLESLHGDAGDLTGSAQVITTFSENSNTLTRILGSLSASADEDMYRFVITAPTTFVATTFGVGSALGDPQLFLFRSNGTGVAGCDDFPSQGLQATINNSTGLLTTLLPGEYHLAISSFNNDPMSGASVMFAGGGLVGPLVGGSITSWTNFGGSSGSYIISLTSVAAVPVPSGIVLAGLGLAGLGGIALRRRKMANS
jgi:MYXO-CTERM domain-containing protein